MERYNYSINDSKKVLDYVYKIVCETNKNSYSGVIRYSHILAELNIDLRDTAMQQDIKCYIIDSEYLDKIQAIDFDNLREQIVVILFVKVPMPTWKIPVCWTMVGSVKIDAPTLNEAIEFVDGNLTLPLPVGEYLSDSFKIDYIDEPEYIREVFNNNQKDMKQEKTKQDFYDELCKVLTDWEGQKAVDNDLYNMLVDIQNNWENIITKQED